MTTCSHLSCFPTLCTSYMYMYVFAFIKFLLILWIVIVHCNWPERLFCFYLNTTPNGKHLYCVAAKFLLWQQTLFLRAVFFLSCWSELGLRGDFGSSVCKQVQLLASPDHSTCTQCRWSTRNTCTLGGVSSDRVSSIALNFGHTNVKFTWFPYTRFHCQVCEQKLETGEYSEEELQKLKYPLVSHLWQHRKEPSQVRVFTTSGNYVDNIISGYHKFPESIVRFIETSGRYDVVLDSLNVGFFTGPNLDPERVNTVSL